MLSCWGCKIVQAIRESLCCWGQWSTMRKWMSSISLSHDMTHDLKDQTSQNEGCKNKCKYITSYWLCLKHTLSVLLQHILSLSLARLLSHMWSFSSSLPPSNTVTEYSAHIRGWQLNTSQSPATWMEKTGAGKPHVTYNETPSHTLYTTLKEFSSIFTSK